MELGLGGRLNCHTHALCPPNEFLANMLFLSAMKAHLDGCLRFTERKNAQNYLLLNAFLKALAALEENWSKYPRSIIVMAPIVLSSEW